jgi:hypothetical protein
MNQRKQNQNVTCNVQKVHAPELEAPAWTIGKTQNSTYMVHTIKGWITKKITTTSYIMKKSDLSQSDSFQPDRGCMPQSYQPLHTHVHTSIFLHPHQRRQYTNMRLEFSWSLHPV